MSTVVPIRLTGDELRMLDEVCKSNSRGDLNRSELFRLLLHREYARRKGVSSKGLRFYETAFRDMGGRKKLSIQPVQHGGSGCRRVERVGSDKAAGLSGSAAFLTTAEKDKAK